MMQMPHPINLAYRLITIYSDWQIGMIDRFYRHYLTRIINAFLVCLHRTLIYQRFVIASSASIRIAIFLWETMHVFNVYRLASSAKFPEIVAEATIHRPQSVNSYCKIEFNYNCQRIESYQRERIIIDSIYLLILYHDFTSILLRLYSFRIEVLKL